MSVVLPQRHPNAPEPGSVLPSHYVNCFGCGSAHPNGLHLRIELGEGLDLAAVWLVKEEHQGAPGLVHGGILSTAFDEVLGALNWLLLAPAVTARLEVNFRAPIPVGSQVHFNARIVNVEGRKVSSEAQGRFPDGTLVGEASGLFIQVPPEHFTTHGTRVGPSPMERLADGAELNP